MKRVLLLLAILGLVAGSGTAFAGQDGNGNGAPNGPHYNLNLIGFSNGDNVKNTTGSGGN